MTEPYRPITPNEHWLAGEQARKDGIPRIDCPISYRGSRWEWEAGWDYCNWWLTEWAHCERCDERFPRGLAYQEDDDARLYCSEKCMCKPGEAGDLSTLLEDA